MWRPYSANDLDLLQTLGIKCDFYVLTDVVMQQHPLVSEDLAQRMVERAIGMLADDLREMMRYGHMRSASQCMLECRFQGVESVGHILH